MISKQTIPIKTIHLFPILDDLLIELLKSLAPDEWNKPTVAKLWTVKDIASHLLDGNVRTLSFFRDGYFGEQSVDINSYQELVEYLNKLNATWLSATKRLSPRVIIELLEATGKQYCECLANLNPFDRALFSVAWAGEEESKNWFHIAREYTEKFHHQQQIREAVGKHGLMTKELFYPFIDTFICGLPHAYRNTQAENGTVLKLTITTDVGGHWYLVRRDGHWHLTKTTYEHVATKISMNPSIAWKLFSKGITMEVARQHVIIDGNRQLGEVALTMISVMA